MEESSIKFGLETVWYGQNILQISSFFKEIVILILKMQIKRT